MLADQPKVGGEEGGGGVVPGEWARHSPNHARHDEHLLGQLQGVCAGKIPADVEAQGILLSGCRIGQAS